MNSKRARHRREGMPFLILTVALAGLVAGVGCRKAPREPEETPPHARSGTGKQTRLPPPVHSKPRIEPKPPPPRDIVQLEASVLWRQYQADPQAADRSYKGKQLEIAGKVAAAGQERGRGFIELAHARDDALKLRCYFLPAQSAALDRLARDMPVRVRGKCLGQIGLEITLINCTLPSAAAH